MRPEYWSLSSECPPRDAENASLVGDRLRRPASSNADSDAAETDDDDADGSLPSAPAQEARPFIAIPEQRQAAHGQTAAAPCPR